MAETNRLRLASPHVVEFYGAEIWLEGRNE
jgi:hypothetical protein